jgi:hypothetical protein
MSGSGRSPAKRDLRYATTEAISNKRQETRKKKQVGNRQSAVAAAGAVAAAEAGVPQSGIFATLRQKQPVTRYKIQETRNKKQGKS